jgi:TolB-like protein
MSLLGPLIRFGDIEVDTRTGEFRRQGVKVNLPDQPFRVLILLLGRPGQVVTREELTKELWPADTFVDFDHGLNKIINKLRAAFGDTAGKPLYIETLPQRGYRFVAPIETVAASRDAPQASPALKIDSLAVLPLHNLSGDPEQEYFSDGMTEELIFEIARIRALRVISRTSVMQYKGTTKSLPAIARELSVDVVVEGSVARSGEKVRVSAKLILAAEDRSLWSCRYERNLRDVLSLQVEVAQDIAHQIHRVLDPVEASVGVPRQIDPPAYEAYLKGNFFRDRINPLDLEKSIRFYTQAIDLDPTCARAYGALARCHLFVGIAGLRHPVEVFRNVRMNALKAIELDETVAASHIALASVNVFDSWDWAAAEAESRRAVELNPGDPTTHGHLGDYLSIRGRHVEAIEAAHRALELAPNAPEYNNWLALFYYRARRYDESISQCRKALAMDPHLVNVLWFLALSLVSCPRSK